MLFLTASKDVFSCCTNPTQRTGVYSRNSQPLRRLTYTYVRIPIIGEQKKNSQMRMPAVHLSVLLIP